MKALTSVLFVTLLATGAYAQAPTTPHEHPKTDTAKTGGTAKKEKLTPKDLQVLAHYHEVNQMETDLGKLAVKQSANPAVKSYAEMLIKDHTESDKQMMGLAKKTGQTIPKEKPATEADKAEKAEQKKQAMELKKLKGPEFDRLYLQMMVDGHDREVAKADAMAAEAQNPEVQEMVRAKKPVLQAHADQARELLKSSAQASNDTTAKPPAATAPAKK